MEAVGPSWVEMRLRLLVILLTLSAVFSATETIAMRSILAAVDRPLGTVWLDNVPVYHGPAQFHWELARKPSRIVTLGVFCNQPPAGWEYIAELPVSNALTGSAEFVIDNTTSSAVPGHLDYTLPADCQAYIWDERLVSQNKPAVLTTQVFFTISP